MSEPALHHNVEPHPATTVPAAKYRVLVATLEEQMDECAALRKALARETRQVRTLQREIDDLLDQAADRDTVRTCLVYWRDRTGRDERTRIDLSTGRARHVRWIVRHEPWGPRGFCVAVLGLMDTAWFVERGKTDVKHLCTSHGVYDEARFEELLCRGRARLGEAA